jgi:predicted DNA-binding protein (MmcQ/YjbR family)
MNIDAIRKFTKSLPSVTEDIKWGNDLCFCIADKMFLVVGMNESPTSVSFKVPDEDFDEISSREGFQPAPYVARYKWVKVGDIGNLSKKEWEKFIDQSYKLVSDKLPARKKKELGIISQ